MSKNSHTPGPWGLTIARTMAHIHNAAGRLVASLSFKSDEEKANARLVTAAPDLLRELQLGAECIKAQIDGSGGYAVEEVLDGMLEAIAKAKGE